MEVKAGSRWRRSAQPEYGFGYTVLYITNTKHASPKHPEQVVYLGDNGYIWSKPLNEWPGSLVESSMDHCYGVAVSRPYIFCRWWLRTRKCTPSQIGGASAEFYVPLWAWPLELMHRLLFGKATLQENIK